MRISPSSSLWMNPRISHLDPMVWVSQGIIVEDIVTDRSLLTFKQLKAKYDLSHSYYFRYLQLWHAFQTQFQDQAIEIKPLTLENVLKDVDLSKTLSVAYKEMFSLPL